MDLIRLLLDVVAVGVGCFDVVMRKNFAMNFSFLLLKVMK